MLTVTAPAQTNPITLYLVGDSTMADKPLIPANSLRGWGQSLSPYFKKSVHVENHALDGRSTKSFITEGHWAKVIAALKPGDYVIIQFGHNDEKIHDSSRGTAPFGEYSENLKKFIRETRARHATPILATPVARRRFDEHGSVTNSHGVYPEAMRKVAVAEKVPLLELGLATEKLLQRLGGEGSKRVFDWVPAGEFGPHSKAHEDNSHFNAYGASRVCDLAVIEIAAKVPGLAMHLNGRVKQAQPVEPALEK